jgi:sugar phosphate isomerase/epimerase
MHRPGSGEAAIVQLGVSSYAAVQRPLTEAAADLLALGVGIEIMCEPPHAWPAPVPWQGGRVTSLHMPILGINLASTNPGIREEAIRQVTETIREAARLGAAGVVVHPGSPPHEEIMPRDRGLPFIVDSLQRLCGAAQGAGVQIYLENMPDIAPADGQPKIGRRIIYGVTYEELRLIYERVGHPALRLCLDLGHAFLAGPSVMDAMLRDQDVVHVHVNDGRGWRDDHLAWGDGEIAKTVDLARDLPPSVRTVVFEVKSLEACRTSLARAAQTLVERR